LNDSGLHPRAAEAVSLRYSRQAAGLADLQDLLVVGAGAGQVTKLARRQPRLLCPGMPVETPALVTALQRYGKGRR